MPKPCVKPLHTSCQLKALLMWVEHSGDTQQTLPGIHFDFNTFAPLETHYGMVQTYPPMCIKSIDEFWVREVTPPLSNHMVTHSWNHLLKQRKAGNSGSSLMIRFSMLSVSVWLLYMKISVFLKRKPFILYRYAELSYSTSRPNTDCPMSHIQYRALAKSLVVQ